MVSTILQGVKLQLKLLCPNCLEPFLAIETPAPNTNVSTKGLKSSKMSTKNQARHRKGEHIGGYTTYQMGKKRRVFLER